MTYLGRDFAKGLARELGVIALVLALCVGGMIYGAFVWGRAGRDAPAEQEAS